MEAHLYIIEYVPTYEFDDVDIEINPEVVTVNRLESGVVPLAYV
jgi:hypothetical protein